MPGLRAVVFSGRPDQAGASEDDCEDEFGVLWDAGQRIDKSLTSARGNKRHPDGTGNRSRALKGVIITTIQDYGVMMAPVDGTAASPITGALCAKSLQPRLPQWQIM